MKKRVITIIIIAAALSVLIFLMLSKGSSEKERDVTGPAEEAETKEDFQENEESAVRETSFTDKEPVKETPEAAVKQSDSHPESPEPETEKVSGSTQTAAEEPGISEEPPDDPRPDASREPETVPPPAQEEIKEPQFTDYPQEPEAAAAAHEHTHIWTEITETVHHDAVTRTVHHEETGHEELIVDEAAWDETVLLTEAYDEEIPVYEVHEICDCGLDFTAAGYQQSDITAHAKAHAMAGESSGWATGNVLAGYEIIHHEAVYEIRHHDAVTHTEWIIDQEAWDETVTDAEAYDETVITGYRCTTCGAVK